MIRLLALLVSVALLGACSNQSTVISAEHPLKFQAATHDLPQPDAKPIVVSGTAQPVFLLPQTILTGRDVVSASATTDQWGMPAIDLIFVPEAADQLFAYTSQNPGGLIAIVFEDEVIVAPTVWQGLRERAQITGNFTDAEVQEILSSIHPE
ncbi:MAG: hypothetical protein AAF750_02495 [Planctomycetota bacterium]